MAELNALISALEKADAAGNVEDARFLASIIRRQMGGDIQPQKEQAGFFSSLKESASTLLSAPEAARFGAAGKGEEDAAREALLKAQESERVGTSLQDVISGEGKFTDWAKQLAGGSAGALAAPGAAAIAAGTVTGPIGAAIAGGSVLAAQYLTEFLGTQAKEQKKAIEEGRTPEETSVGKAALAAGAATGLDVIGVGKVFKPVFQAFPVVRRMFGEGGEQLAKKTEDDLVKAFEKGNITVKNGIARGVAGGLMFEMPQEVAQTALERWQAGQSLTDAEARAEYLEAAAGGLLLGSTLGGVSGGLKSARDRRVAEQLIESRKARLAEQEPAASEEAPAGPVEPAVTPAAAPAAAPVTTPSGIDITEETEAAPETEAKAAPEAAPETEAKAAPMFTEEELAEAGEKQAEKINYTEPPADGSAYIPEVSVDNDRFVGSVTGVEARIEPKTPVVSGEFTARGFTAKRDGTSIFGRTKKADTVKLDVDNYYLELNSNTGGFLRMSRDDRKSEPQFRSILGDEAVDAFLNSSPENSSDAVTATVFGQDYGSEIGRLSQLFTEKYSAKEDQQDVAGRADTAGPAGGVDTSILQPAPGEGTTDTTDTGAVGDAGQATKQTSKRKKKSRTALKEKPLEEQQEEYQDEEIAGYDTPSKLIADSLAAIDKPITQQEYEQHLDYIMQELPIEGEQTLRDAGVIQKDIDASLRRISKFRNNTADRTALKNAVLQRQDLERKRDQNVAELEKADPATANNLKSLIAQQDEQIKERDSKIRRLGRLLNINKTRKKKRHASFVNEPSSLTDKRGRELREALAEADTLGEALTIAANLASTTATERAALLRLASLPGVSDVDFSMEVDIPGFEKSPTGIYDQETDSVTLNYRLATVKTLIHEAEHAATVDAIDNHLDENDKPKSALGQELMRLLDQARSALGDAYGLTNAREFIAEANSNPDFVKSLKQIPSGGTNLFDRFVSWVMKLLGIPRESKMLFNAAMDISRQLEAENVAARKVARREGKPVYPQAAERKKAPELTPQEEIDNLSDNIDKDFETKLTRASLFKNARQYFFSLDGWNHLVKKFQNERVVVKNFQDMLERVNLVKYTGKINNLYDQLTLASGRAESAMNEYATKPIERLESALLKYMKAANLTVKEALKKLHEYSIALHEGERRLVKFLRTVPLNNTKNLTVQIGGANPETIRGTAAYIRKYIYERLADNKDLVSSGATKKYREVLESLVKNYVDPTGFSENGYKATDISDPTYDVAAELSRPAVDLLRKQYAQAEEKNPELKEIFEALGELQKATTELDKKANYWTQPVSNFVDFYGYKHYVPFKGRPEPKTRAGIGNEQADDPRRNPRLTGDYAEGAYAFEGRTSVSDNPILQSIADAARASMRFGRKDVTQAIYNLVTDKDNPTGKPLLEADLNKDGDVETIKFADRPNFDFKKYTSSEYILHYEPNGDIKVIKLADKKMMEGIRRAFRASQPIIQMVNRITSFFGQMHTRFNPSFAPVNFVRDALTNAWTLSSEMGGKEAAQYLGAVASRVADGGIFKTLKFVRMYQKGDFEGIKQLAKKNKFIEDVRDYVKQGGRISYVQGLTAMGQMDELVKDIGRSKLIRSKDQLMTWIDAYTDMFEFTSRAAAFGVARRNYMAKGFTKEEANVRAAAYAKNLANFEQVGEWGRAAGAAFMFFRPAATGAVRAIDAFKPALIPVEKLIKRLPASIRNNEELVAKYRANYEAQAKRARNTMLGLMGAGATIYMMAYMMSDDDEQGRNRVATDDMARWTRYLRLPIPGSENFIQLPWGFGGGAFAALGAQVMGTAVGKTSPADMVGNTITLLLDSYIPVPVSRTNPIQDPAAWLVDSITPSALRPLVEFKMNVDGLGREIYNNKNTRYGDAYTGGDTIPDLYKDVARSIADFTNGAVDFSPNTAYFFINNYVDGLGRVAHGMYGTALTTTGQKGFDPKTDIPGIDSFVGKRSNYDAREFASIEKKIQEKAGKMNMFKSNPEQFMRYLESHPMDAAIVDIYNKQIAQVNKLREAANTIRRSQDFSPKDRKEMLDDIRLMQNMYKRALIDVFKDYDVTP